jgi:small GTP-binding protein
MSEYDYKLKLILCGESNVGKSTFFNHLKFTSFQKNITIFPNILSMPTTPTVGVDFLTLNEKYNNYNIKLHIWDTAGDERFRSVISSYFKDISACIIIFDLTNIKSLESLPYWCSIANTYSTCEHKHPIFLFGNKSDLGYNKHLIDETIINKFIKENNIFHYQSISSVDESFNNTGFIHLLIDTILNKKYTTQCRGISTKESENYITLKDNVQKKKKCCTIS